MHPEIEAILTSLTSDDVSPNLPVLKNAEKLLNYIEDINLERESCFELTPADSLYLLWELDSWEIHIECLANGKISFAFRKNGVSIAHGTNSVYEFIALLEKYLLNVIC